MCDINEKNYDEKKLFPSILAVDFDGTLVENQFPGIGKPDHVIAGAVRAYKEMGWKIILWTCRTDEMLQDAVDFCKEQLGIEFDAVNDNLPEVQKYFGGNTRKVFANLYWDDRNAALCVGGINKPSSLEPMPLIIGEGTILVEDHGV